MVGYNTAMRGQDATFFNDLDALLMAPGRACRDTTTQMCVDPQANKADLDAAKAVCSGCPVRLSCLDFALRTGQSSGVWGGLDDDERAELRRRRVSGQSALQSVS